MKDDVDSIGFIVFAAMAFLCVVALLLAIC
jgi:hypothetical protein